MSLHYRSKNRKSSGRADIKYRNYKPLKNNDKIIKEEEGIVTEDVGGSSWNIFGRVARWFQYKGPGDMGDVPQPGDSNYKYDDTPPFVPSQKNEEAEIEMRRRATLEKSKKKKAKKKVVKVAAPVEESNTNGNENNKNGKMTFNAAFNMPEDDSEDDDEEDALYAEKERLYDIADRDYGKGMWLFRR